MKIFLTKFDNSNLVSFLFLLFDFTLSLMQNFGIKIRYLKKVTLGTGQVLLTVPGTLGAVESNSITYNITFSTCSRFAIRRNGKQIQQLRKNKIIQIQEPMGSIDTALIKTITKHQKNLGCNLVLVKHWSPVKSFEVTTFEYILHFETDNGNIRK